MSGSWVSDMSDSFDISEALSKIADSYIVEVQQAVDSAAEKAAKRLVEITKQTAPVDNHGKHTKRRKHFKNSITYSKESSWRGSTYIWHVKGPDSRLTHLLVHGHLARDGSRVQGNPFLKNACDEVFPQFIADVEEAVKPK